MYLQTNDQTKQKISRTKPFYIFIKKQSLDVKQNRKNSQRKIIRN